MAAETFVDRVRAIITESYVLHEAWNGNVTRDQLSKNFSAVPLEDFGTRDVEGAVRRLERDGHLRREGERYATTDDGREDLQKVERWFRMGADQFGRQRSATRGPMR